MRFTSLAILMALVLSGSVASAHHSYVNFDTNRVVTIEGDLVQLLYANPHLVMRIRAADSENYLVTWQTPAWVERVAHVTPSTFQAGDRLIISASPARDSASRHLAVVREIRRPRDGWSWKRESGPQSID